MTSELPEIPLAHFATMCSSGHKPEAQAKGPRIPSLALQACVHCYSQPQTALMEVLTNTARNLPSCSI